MDAGVPSRGYDRLLRRGNLAYAVGAVVLAAAYSIVTQEGLLASAVAGLLWSIVLVGGYRHVTRHD